MTVDDAAMTPRRRRWLWLVLIAASVVTSLALASSAFITWTTPIGEFPVPQTVMTTGPIHPGDAVEITGTKCMNREFPTEGRSTWVRLSPSRVLRPKSGGNIVVRPKGCTTATYENALPDDISPGVWRIEGINTAFIGPWRQDVPWYTEPFTVTRGTP